MLSVRHLLSISGFYVLYFMYFSINCRLILVLCSFIAVCLTFSQFNFTIAVSLVHSIRRIQISSQLVSNYVTHYVLESGVLNLEVNS